MPTTLDRRAFGRSALGAIATAALAGRARAAEGGSVVVYAALDREFSEPILDAYAAKAGARVAAKYDVESTKTVGLTNRLIAEARRPRCDVFWNNEILNTLRLGERGLLAPVRPSHASEIPSQFRAADGTWHGFAARARILLVNTRLVPEDDRPTGLRDLADPRWKGRVGLAKPLFGTTATHAACLFAAWGDAEAKAFFAAIKRNDARVLSGNKQVALAVGTGELAFGLTDTDDAIIEVEAGRPVTIVYPDRGADALGTLFIPNTLAAIRGGPNPEGAAALIDHLLSPEVEATLARGASAQIPLLSSTVAPVRVETPRTVQAMPADFAEAARHWDAVATYLAAEFAG